MSKLEDIIKGCVKNDIVAQRKLYEKFASQLFVVCLRYAKDTMEAEDILQDAFLKIFDKIGTYRGDGVFEGWMRRIVVNTALNQIRSNKKDMLTEINEEITESTYDGEAHSESGYDFKVLLALIQQLAPRYRLIFNLFAVEGYSHKEIAQELGISEGTSKSQYSRARAILMDLLTKKEKITTNESVRK